MTDKKEINRKRREFVNNYIRVNSSNLTAKERKNLFKKAWTIAKSEIK